MNNLENDDCKRMVSREMQDNRFPFMIFAALDFIHDYIQIGGAI